MLYSNRNLNFNMEMIILLVNRNQLLLYAVTDSRWLGNKTLAQAVEEAIKGGVTFVQIREKEASYDEFKRIALDVKKVTDKYNVPMIINDNVELAKDIDADGVHVGADTYFFHDLFIVLPSFLLNKKSRFLTGSHKYSGNNSFLSLYYQILCQISTFNVLTSLKNLLRCLIKLAVVQISVKALLCQKLFVRSAFNYISIL